MKNDAHRASQVTTLKAVAVVASDPEPALLDSLLDAGDYDVVFLESMDGAYSRIKETTPDLVIICLSLDEPRSFQLLSMLALDWETANIPVLTCVEMPRLAESNPVGLGLLQRASAASLVAMMN